MLRASALSSKSSSIKSSHSKVKKFYSTPSEAVSTVKPFTEIPNLSRFPIIGAIKAMKKIGERDYKYVYAQGGKMGRISVLGMNTLVLHDPKDCKEYMLYEGEFPFGATSLVWTVQHNFEVQRKAGFVEPGVAGISVAGERWKEARLFYQKKMFPPKESSTYLPHIDRSACAIAERVDTFEGDLTDMSRKASMDMFHGFIFGVPSGLFSNPPNEDALAIHDASGRFMTGTVKLALVQKWQTYLPGKFRKMRLDFEKAIIDKKTIWNRLGEAKIKEMIEDEDELRKTAHLAQLAHQHDGDWGKALDDSLEFIAAAIDTTSSGLAWAMYHLAANQKEQDIVREEVDRVLKGQGILDQETLDNLPYLKAFCQESQRMNPVADGPIRRYSKPVVVNGYQIPANTLVFVWGSLAASRDEEIFESAFEFKPSRWLPEAKKERRKNGKAFPHDSPFTLMQFSVGKRMCLGARIADREVVCLLARLVQTYNITLAPNSPIPDVHTPCVEQGVWYPNPVPALSFTRRN